jgi:hypothetical protein
MPAAAAPPAVTPGLWEVRMLRSAGGTAGQLRTYRVCLNEQRAQAPMLPSPPPRQAELLEEARSFNLQFPDPLAPPGRGRVEMTYRWLDPRSFEGSHDVEGLRNERMQYQARWLGADCGSEPSRGMGANGEP